MLSPERADWLRVIADHAAAGLLGEASGPGLHHTSDVFFTSLCDAMEDQYRQGLRESMVQLSLLPDSAHAVG